MKHLINVVESTLTNADRAQINFEILCRAAVLNGHAVESAREELTCLSYEIEDKEIKIFDTIIASAPKIKESDWKKTQRLAREIIQDCARLKEVERELEAAEMEQNRLHSIDMRFTEFLSANNIEVN